MLDYIIDRFLMAMCALSFYNMTSSFSRYIDAKCLSIYAQELRNVAFYDGVKEGFKGVKSLIPVILDLFTLSSNLSETSNTGPTDLNEESQSILHEELHENSHEVHNDLHESHEDSTENSDHEEEIHTDSHEEDYTVRYEND